MKMFFQLLFFRSSNLQYLYQPYIYIKYKLKFKLKNFENFFVWGLGIGDWGLGIGDWGLGPIPNPQSPIPNIF